VRRGVFSNEWVDNILTNLECPMIRGGNGPVVGPVTCSEDDEIDEPVAVTEINVADTAGPGASSAPIQP
jgi:hypothetical protein